MRINHYVASAGELSRRAADAAIAAGRVRVNGHLGKLGQVVDARDKVMLDGKPLVPISKHTYVILNKPAGYVSSRSEQGSDPILYELLPAPWRKLRIAGRLDRDSTGLIVLSTDGEFIQTLTHPSSGKQKTYEITLESPISPADVTTLQSGVKLTDGKSTVGVVSAKGKNLVVTLGEGRNRQLRRTFGALGYTITRLHRTKMGNFELGGLAPGAWAEVTETGKLR